MNAPNINPASLDDELVRQLRLFGDQKVKASILLPAAQSALEQRGEMARRMGLMAMELQARRGAAILDGVGELGEDAVEALRRAGGL